ncbi:GNAT family N-acetyltransferase [Acidovorax sp. NCPPB 3859]|nr:MULTISPECIES: GNAT family N-acetyltransferase [unclassified Acidovorax]MDA8448671.1 GNAT family N-acetyltransferase [Acidovorax sp. GBBC 3297]MDA8458210.1 GNAT family N-acetyltransferase [Acidovorax sp. GBBC 3333]MDA8463248.1 GNAT family N-acetyltransferase [Acidovorax sp. GBBC 3332]MDA8468147.1 GNAT family N-acetyltransferase [Acidovorax sp. GBBC 3299]WCM79755.1 GNAT family N-acetyltransferase [Acidovorax sp. GBBC 712]
MPLQFACPAPLLARGITLHEERAADLPALRALFRHQRWAEFAMLPWDDAAKTALLDQQFDAQRHHYASVHPQVLFLVLMHQEQTAGRLYLGRSEAGDLGLLDILLSPRYRGQGLGTALIGALQDQAAIEGRRVLLEVGKGNPAAGLYRRLGFCPLADTGIGWHMAWVAASALLTGVHAAP